VVPLREFCALVEPHYPQPGNGGRRWEWSCVWCGKDCCFWHRLSLRAKVTDHGRAAEAGGRPKKTKSKRLHRPGRTRATWKTLAYSEFP
jgi:hypothetical protein